MTWAPYSLPQFFSTFDIDKLGKIHPFCLKEDFLICKIAKFANDLLKTNEDIGPQSPKILQMFVLWGGGGGGGTNLPPTIQTSVNFRNFVEVYICSLTIYHFKTWEYYQF